MTLERLVSLNWIKSFNVEAADGEVGTCEDLYFDDNGFIVRYLVIGGKNWMLRHRLLLPPFTVGEIDKKNQLLYIELTLEQIIHSPLVTRNLPVPREFEQKLYNYYGWPPYWKYPPSPPIVFNQAPVTTGSKKAGHPLRSCKQMQNYELDATDGHIGMVEDYIIDTHYWVIRYLHIGMHVSDDKKQLLITPDWISHINWHENQIILDLSSETMQNAPAYDTNISISREYEYRLYKHFERRIYWK